MKLSNNVVQFLEEEIYPKLFIKEINDDNSSTVVNFIIDNYEIPLSQAEDAGEVIDKELLHIAALAVTEITKNW